jgi:DNA-binding NtrC family response regulator
MKESIVIEIERDLLLEAFKLADKNDLNLPNYVSSLIEDAVKYDKGEIRCSKAHSNEICLDSLLTDVELKATMDEFEKKIIQRALVECDNHQSRAAGLLGIGKGGLSQKIQKYNLK